MKYYKIMQNSEYIGVGTSDDLRCYQEKHGIYLVCKEQKAQYIEVKDKMYHAMWMRPIADGCTIAEVHEIGVDEYNILKRAEETGEEIEVNEDTGETITQSHREEIDADELHTLEYVKQQKIKEMSVTCNIAIQNGFDAKLSDGAIHHFSLTAQDQINLVSLTTFIAQGHTQIPYHADGELCKFYDMSDILLITSEAANFKLYHTSYFNALKNYIMSLDSIEKVDAIVYGCEIPEEYLSDVLRQLSLFSDE